MVVALAAWPVLPRPNAVVYQGMVCTACFCEPSPGEITASIRLIRGTFFSVPVPQDSMHIYPISIGVRTSMNVRVLMYARSPPVRCWVGGVVSHQTLATP